MEKSRYVGQDSRYSKREGKGAVGAQPNSKRRNCRQSERENNRKRGLCGYDGGKKIKGRKRHIAVDTEGFLLQAHITSAALSDKEGAKRLLKSKRLKPIKKMWADSGYGGEDLRQIAHSYGKDLEIVKRPAGKVRTYSDEWKVEWVPVDRGFRLLPRRWVVERTFAWIGKYRRMSKDYEYNTRTSRAMVYLCMIRTMLNRYVRTI